jgi:hypothetical protein
MNKYFHFNERTLKWLFIAAAVVLGAIQAWTGRYAMNPDGISYLDVGDAFLRGDWRSGINAHWSPFYALLLSTPLFLFSISPYGEFAFVHLVNFFIYLAALAAFDFLLRALIDSREENFRTPLLIFGYALFLVSSLRFITLSLVTPDMLVAAFIFLIAGLLVRIRGGAHNWSIFFLLGTALGFGYLAKAPLFLIAFVFLGVGIFAVGDIRKVIPRISFAFAVFMLITSSFIVPLSLLKNRFTFGDSGKINYAWQINNIPYIYWQGEGSDNGVPLHPMRKVFDHPPVYEFATPIGGTYPPWYDPSYWSEGSIIHFNMRGHLEALLRSGRLLYEELSTAQFGSIAVGLLALILVSGQWRRPKTFFDDWLLLVPALAGLGMYALVLVRMRYVAPFFVLMGLSIFSRIRLPASRDAEHVGMSITCAMVFMIMILLAVSALAQIMRETTDEQGKIARTLQEAGIQSGDRVAVIGGSFNGWSAFWARLLKVKIVAEIPSTNEARLFWENENTYARVQDIFSKTGARVMVAELLPDNAHTKDWQRVGQAGYYLFSTSTVTNMPR